MHFDKHEQDKVIDLLLSEDDNNKLLAYELLANAIDNIRPLRRPLVVAAYLNQSFRQSIEGKLSNLLVESLSPVELHRLQDEIIIIDYARYKFGVPQGWHTANNPLRKYLRLHEEKIDDYLPIFQKSPNRFAKYYWMLANRVQKELKSPSKALNFYKIALQLRPSYTSARMSYAMILHQYYLKKGQRIEEYDKVVDYYLSAFVEKEKMHPYVNAAMLCYEMKDYARSAKIYEEGLRINPEDSTLLNNFANLQFKSFGDYNKAKQLAEQGLEAAPHDCSLLDTLAHIEMEGFDNLAKAEAYFLEALKTDGTHHYSLTGLGDLYVRKGNYQKAEEYYSQGLYDGMQFSSRVVREVIEKLEKMVDLYTHYLQNAPKADYFRSKLYRLKKGRYS